MEKRYKVKLQISYDGTQYKGFQKQTTTDQTIQGVLESVLSRLFCEPIQVVGSGRTDAGVHAISQYVHFWTHKNPEDYNLTYSLNGRRMPSDIVIKKAWLAPDDFHALSSDRKTYKYKILNRPLPSALRRNFAYHWRLPLDLNYLNQVSEKILGVHDFSSFQTTGTDSKTTKKQIYTSSWERSAEDIVTYTICGDGFLKQMVRNLVGTFLWMERQKSPLETLDEILQSRDRQAAKDTAPAHGLYIYDVEYSNELDNKCREI